MNKVGEFYNQHHIRDSAYNHEAFRDSYKRYISHLGQPSDIGNLTVLEAGGIGGKAVSFQNAGANAYHIDLAEQGITWSGGFGVTSMLGSILDPHPELNEKFDIVICDGVIHHTADPTLCLKNLKNWVKPDGALYLSFYEAESLYHLVVEYGRKIISRKAITIEQMDELFSSSKNKEFVRTQKRNFLDDLFVPIYASTTRSDFLSKISGLKLIKINHASLSNHKIETLLKKDSDGTLAFNPVSPSNVVGITLDDKNGSIESIFDAAFIFYKSCYLRSLRARLSCLKHEHNPFLTLSPRTQRSYFISAARKQGLL